MASRVPLLIAIGALTGLAQAGIWENGNPPGLHGRQTVVGVQVKGWFSSFKLTGRHGRTVVVHLDRAQALTAPLDLPSGDWADLTLFLDGPVTVSAPDASPIRLDLTELSVPLDDPHATTIKLEWTLPDGLLAALHAGVDPAALATPLAAALQDGGLAVGAQRYQPQ